MQQRLQMSAGVEVTTLAPENDVGDRERARGTVLGRGRNRAGVSECKCGKDGSDEDHRQRWEQPPHAPLIEANNRKCACGVLLKKDTGDQESGNDEEYVDANESTG